MSDSKTTPRWLQIPGLLLLLAVAGYQSLAYTYALGAERPGWLQSHPFALWPATWQMFTYKGVIHTLVEGEVRVDGAWQAVDLEALFPYTWESGPRYARTSFRESASRMRTLASAACGRIEPTPEAVRFRSVRWKKTRGSSTQPRERPKTEPLVSWECDRTYRLPGGTVW